MELNEVCENVIADFSRVKKWLTVKLMHEDYVSDEVLKLHCVKSTYLDFILLPGLFVKKGDVCFMPVMEENLIDWGMTAEKVISYAKENVFNETANILPVSQVSGVTPKTEAYRNLYVISDADYFNGSRYLIDARVFKEISNRYNDDVVICPTSVDSLTCSKYRDVPPFELLLNLRKGNETMDDDVFLSDNIYIYRKISGIIDIIS